MLQNCLNSDKLEAGLDEAGRGCLFGRVYVAAVILPHDIVEEKGLIIRDSKKVSKKKRAKLRKFIEENAIDYCVAYSESHEIDEYNILKTTMNTMHKSIDGLKIRPKFLLIDGNYFIPYKNGDEQIDHRCIIDGDNSFKAIAAASILAKEYHDEYIGKLCKENPEYMKYDLHHNKGYGTRTHIEAIEKYGITPEHRRTFGICKRISLFTKNNNTSDENVILM